MRLHEEAAAGLKGLRPLSVVQLASYVAGANALAALNDQINASCTTCHKQYRPNVYPKQ